MKIWGIIATVLLVVVIGLGGWLYMENKNLKNEKSKVEAELSTAKTTQAQSEAKKIAANKKLGLLTTIFAGISTQDQSLAVYDVIKSLNDATLTADWTAMTNSKPGDDTGNKMLTDLLASAINDLK